MTDYVFSNNQFTPYEGDFVNDFLGGVPGPWGGDHPPNYKLLGVLGQEDSAATLIIYEALHPDENPFPFWVNPILFEGSSAMQSAILIPKLPDLMDFLSRYMPLSEVRRSLSSRTREGFEKETTEEDKKSKG